MESRFGYQLAYRPILTSPAVPAGSIIIGEPDDALESQASELSHPVGSTQLRTGQATALPVDFSQVRVHTGPSAAESASAIGAVAYTVGADIVFAAGRYAPLHQEGRQLLAHELAHVIQQEAGTRGGLFVQRQVEAPQPKGRLGQAVEWVKEKFTRGEGAPDLDIQTGLERMAKVCAMAKGAASSLEQANKFGEAAEKFENASKNAKGLISAKEWGILIIEFTKALDEAENVNLARDDMTPEARLEEGGKLFALIAAGARIGKKVFPPPFKSDFDFLSRVVGLENVAKPYFPDRKGGPHSEQWGAIEP